MSSLSLTTHHECHRTTGRNPVDVVRALNRDSGPLQTDFMYDLPGMNRLTVRVQD